MWWVAVSIVVEDFNNMTFLQCFLVVFGFSFVFFRMVVDYAIQWKGEDEAYQRLMRLGPSNRIVIKDEAGNPIMFFDDYVTLPYRSECEFGAGRE